MGEDYEDYNDEESAEDNEDEVFDETEDLLNKFSF